MEALIRREMEFAKSGEEAHLIFKLNSLVDKKMINLLYEASQAGVRQDLLVRGICCLRPGVPGLSDNIKVTSIVGTVPGAQPDLLLPQRRRRGVLP